MRTTKGMGVGLIAVLSLLSAAAALAQPAWTGFATGLNDQVLAITSYRGELYVGGDFTDIGGDGGGDFPPMYIARWTGSYWTTLDAGTNAQVSALTAWTNPLDTTQEYLVAGGGFGLPYQRIAKWDGSTWSQVGAVNPFEYDGGIYALTVYQGKLIAGGWFSNVFAGIAQFDGEEWTSLGTGLPDRGEVFAMTTWADPASDIEYLIVAGAFQNAGGVYVNHIAKWDGANWSDIGGGVGQTPGEWPPFVYAVASFNGDLYAGGLFTTAGGQPANRVARWNGVKWLPLDGGVGGNNMPFVKAMAVHSSGLTAPSLYIGGNFPTAGEQVVNFITRWDGTQFYPVGAGFDAQVMALSSWRPDTGVRAYLVAGGVFCLSGDTIVNHIARW